MPTACLLEHVHILFQGLQSMYTPLLESLQCIHPLWNIPTISQKLAKGQRSGSWWICQEEIRIVHPAVEV